MIRFLIPLIFILFANASSVCLFKKNFLKLLPLTLMIIVFPLFLCGLLFSSFKIGITINILYSVFFLFYLFKNMKDEKIIKEFKDNYFSIGIITFFTLYIFFYFYDCNRSFQSWDEFSHWGVMLKEMFRLDNFYTITDSTLLVHKDYPPFVQLYEFFFLKISGGYSEAFSIMFIHLLEFSFILSFVNEKNNINIKNIIKTTLKSLLLIGIIISIILLFDMHSIINSIYNDYILSILVAYILSLIIVEKDKLSNYLLLNLSIVSIFLLLTKQVAIAFYMMILFFYLICLYRKIKLEKKILFKLLIILVFVPLLFYKSWSLFVDHYNIYKQFDISDIKFNELIDVFFNLSNDKHIIVSNFVNAIFKERLSTFNLFSISYFSSFVIYSLLVLLFAIKNTMYSRLNIFKYYLTILIGFIGYSFLMLILYIFCFGGEGYTLASFNRYMDTYLLIEYISLFIIFMKNNEEKNKFISYLIVLGSLAIVMPKSSFKGIIPKINKTPISEEERIAKRIEEKIGKGKKVYVLSQDTDGFYQFSIKYYANPIITNIYNFSFPLTCEKECKDLFDKTTKEYMLKFDYLYVHNTTEEVNDKYDFAFKNIENEKIYKIKEVNNELLLREVE